MKTLPPKNSKKQQAMRGQLGDITGTSQESHSIAKKGSATRIDSCPYKLWKKTCQPPLGKCTLYFLCFFYLWQVKKYNLKSSDYFSQKIPFTFYHFWYLFELFWYFSMTKSKKLYIFFLYFFVLFMLFSWFLLSFKYGTFSSKRDFFFFFLIYKNYRKIQKSKKYMWVAVCPGHRHLWSHSGQLYQSSKP